mmetsp:Transcript_31035/g.53397  ORF Transcript_31035/g.53397 Transcript_31035/m.53397 type:complete len:81 (-) Transcript_31035:2-244(-)
MDWAADDGSTPLIMAWQNDHMEVIDLLVEAGAVVFPWDDPRVNPPPRFRDGERIAVNESSNINIEDLHARSGGVEIMERG